MSKLTPKIDIILSIIQNQLSWPAALSEFVDNSLGPDAGNATTVDITIERDSITVEDDGAGFEDINELNQLGAGHSRLSKRDIGLYGVGSKQAQLWIGARTKVDTIHKGLRHRHVFAWPLRRTRDGGVSLTKNADWLEPYNGVGSKSPKGAAGTLIVVNRLHPGRPRLNTSAVAEQLGQTYAPALIQGRRIRLHDQRRKYAAHIEVVPDQPKKLTDTGTFEGQLRGMPYRLFVGHMEDREARHNRMFICFGHRVIVAETNPWKDQALPSHFYGVIHLDDKWKKCLSANKLDIASYKEELLEHALEKCKHLVERYDEYEKELNIEIFLADMSEHMGRHMRLLPKTEGEYGAGERVHTEQEGGNGQGAREAKSQDGGNDAEEQESPTTPIRLFQESLGNESHRVVEIEGEFRVSLNSDLPYVRAAFTHPFEASAIWGLASAALSDYMIANRHKMAEAFLDRVSPFSQMLAFWIGKMPEEYAPKSKRSFFGGET